jgi:hypothetical protein
VQDRATAPRAPAHHLHPRRIELPNSLIEETILRLFELHGIEGAKVLDA